MERLLLIMVILCTAMLMLQGALAEEAEQRDIPYMKDWPKLPSPYRTRDWTDTARRIILLTLDGQADEPYFPVTAYFEQAEALSGGAKGPMFGTQTYLRSTPVKPGYGEAVTQLAAVVSASLTEGMNPRDLYGMDFVRMAQAYFNRTPDGRGFVSNNAPAEDCAGSYWYTLYPTCLYFHLAALHPEDETLQAHMREVADTWLEAIGEIASWDVQGYSLKDRQLVPGNHREPEGIFGAAYVMLMAHARFGDEAYLEAAVSLMQQAARRVDNPYYEILGSYAPYVAARLNAQENAGLPLDRMMDWVFNDGAEAARRGWGVIGSRWGEYDAYGLAGSLTDTQGYAFSMNTFVSAGMLAPVARYAPQYSRALGQYLTAVASNSHMFFPDGLPAQMQDDSAYVEQTGLHYLVYEGVRNQGRTTPFATGDAKVFAPDVEGTNFSFYSSGPIGMFSAMISPTNVPEILCFDLLKTDFEREAAYPTYLLYNPLETMQEVCMTLPQGGPYDVFDAVSGKYLAKGVSGSAVFTLAPDTAVQAVLLPKDAKVTEQDGCLMADGIVVRYPAAWLDMPGVEEYALLREGDALPLELILPGDDRLVSLRVTLGGREIAAADSLDEPVHLLLPEGAAYQGALNVYAETARGRRLMCSRSVKVLPSDMTPQLHLEGDALKKAFPRTDNCRVYQEENGIRLKVSGGWSSFRMPRMALQAGQDAVLVLKVTEANAFWSVQLYLNRTGETIVLRPDGQGCGEYLIHLGEALEQAGIPEANVHVQFTVSSERVGEVVLEQLTILAPREE